MCALAWELVMLRKMLSDSVSATSATNVGSAHVYKRLPSRERALTDIKIERMNSDSATGDVSMEVRLV